MGWERSSRTLTDTDMMYILRRMEKYGLYSEKRIQAAIRIVANENRYHPIREYLNALQWDGTERIAHALHRFLGAAEDEFYRYCNMVEFCLSTCQAYCPCDKCWIFDVVLLPDLPSSVFCR